MQILTKTHKKYREIFLTKCSSENILKLEILVSQWVYFGLNYLGIFDLRDFSQLTANAIDEIYYVNVPKFDFSKAQNLILGIYIRY